jgi:hypothetical protein
MTFDPSATKQDLVWLAEMEPARRLEGLAWMQAGAPNTSCYYVVHPEGKLSRVKECLKSTGIIATYTPDVANLAACQAAASSWYWDAANSRLYVHTSTGADPGGGLFLVDSYFWERIADRKIDLDGHQYRPLLDPSSIPDLSFEATQFSTGGIAQSFGQLKVINDGYWDSKLAAYVYEGKRVIIKFGKPTDAYAVYIPYFDGYMGGNEWTDGTVVFENEDPRRFQE